MISDSPYKTRNSIFTPTRGMFAGMAGSLLMLLVISALQPFTGLSFESLLIRFGQTVVPIGGLVGGPSLLVTATGVHVFVGGMLGLLYAVSQHRIAVRGLIAVGVFYGFVIWAASSLLAHALFGSSLQSALRSYPWFLACLAYGMFLAGFAVWTDRQRPSRSANTIAID